MNEIFRWEFSEKEKREKRRQCAGKVEQGGCLFGRIEWGNWGLFVPFQVPTHLQFAPIPSSNSLFSLLPLV